MPAVTSYGLRALLLLAWPVVVARSTQAVIGFCDALMTAPLGEAALAATTTGAMNTFVIAVLPMGLVFIVQSFASQYYGKGDLLAARRYGWYGLILAAASALVIGSCIPLVGPGLGLLSYEPAVQAHMTDYLSIRLLAIGAIMGSEVIGNWYGGLGNTRLHMVASIATMVLNVALNWLLIEGNWGAPALGVEGAALASTLASWAGFALLLVVFLRRWYVPGRIEGVLVLTRRELVRMIRYGLPNGLNWFFEFAAFALFVNVVIADLGTTTLAAMMVVINVNSVSFMPAFGLASSGAILAGQAIGAGDHDQVPGIVKRTAGLTLTWQGSVGVIYLVVPAVLVGWFAPPEQTTPELLEIGTVLLAISAAWQLFDALGMTLSEALRSAGDTAWTLWARLSMAWVVFAPASVLTVMVAGGGHVSAMLCIVGYMALLAGALLWRFRSGAWREIDLTGDELVLD